MGLKLKSTLGAFFAIVGFGSAVIGFFGTAYVFFSSDRPLLGLIALFVPPADIVLGFVAHPILGVMAVGGMLVGYSGLALFSE